MPRNEAFDPATDAHDEAGAPPSQRSEASAQRSQRDRPLRLRRVHHPNQRERSSANERGANRSAGRFEFVAWAIVGRFALSAAVLLICAAVAEWRVDDDKTHKGEFLGTEAGRWWALAFGFGIVALSLLLLQLMAANLGSSGHRRRRSSLSTSLTQLGIWTVAAGTGFAYLLGRVMFDDAALSKVLPGETWDQYLILLGGPFAAAVLAKGITTYKLDAGTLQKSDPMTMSPKQVVTDDSGSADLVDSQYLLFDVVALGYFVVQLSSTGVLPSMPSPLLAMTSTTAGVYVANKAAQRNAPTITSVNPTTAEPGTVITILGSNLTPRRTTMSSDVSVSC